MDNSTEDSFAPLRKPPWLRVRLQGGAGSQKVKHLLSHHGLHSICQEARCPNIAECFDEGTATFLILGSICTRQCLYCHVAHGTPSDVDPSEVERLIAAVKGMGLRYVVITSVTRDDLPDGGAEIFQRCIEGLRLQVPECRVEVLIPDFRGSHQALESVLAAKPDVLNHNMEVAPALFKTLRPQGDYRVSLEVLRLAKQHGTATTKSGFMVGFGESALDIAGLMRDIQGTGCDHLTVGQYQQPTRGHYPVRKYYHPDEFAALKAAALRMGFRHVEAGPLVRSSYHAARAGQTSA